MGPSALICFFLGSDQSDWIENKLKGQDRFPSDVKFSKLIKGSKLHLNEHIGPSIQAHPSPNRTNSPIRDTLSNLGPLEHDPNHSKPAHNWMAGSGE